MRQIKIGNVTETVVERADYPPERLKQILGNETVAVLGYGVQGRGQSLNMKDNGVNVIVGQREKAAGWDLAQQDGWVPGKTLFPLEEAAQRGTIIQYLLSDAGQKEQWPALKPLLTAGKALYFSHGFSIVYSDQTGVVPPKDIDVILVAPKGSGHDGAPAVPGRQGHQRQLRRPPGRDRPGARPLPGPRHRHRLRLPVRDDLPEGSLQRPDRRARRADGRDLRSVAGAVRGAAGARPFAVGGVQRDGRGGDAEPLSADRRERHGLDVRQLLDDGPARRPRLVHASSATPAKPVFEELYQKVAAGDETRRVLEANSRTDYRQQLEKELKEVADSEMWQAGTVVRSLRPERASKTDTGR